MCYNRRVRHEKGSGGKLLTMEVARASAVRLAHQSSSHVALPVLPVLNIFFPSQL